MRLARLVSRRSRRLAALVASAGLAASLGSVPATASAREVQPSIPRVTLKSPVRLVAASSPLSDVSSRVWRPDEGYAIGGRLVHSRHAITHTGSPALYRHARLGVTGYDIKVGTPGTYFVDLLTAETRGAEPGHREWSVTAENRNFLTYAVDVAKLAGPDRAWHVVFAVPVVDGTLNLRFVRHKGRPLVSAVEVGYQSASTTRSMTFRDEFTGAAGQPPSALRWGYAVGGNGFGNQEQQTYTTRRDNAALDGQGHLFITARKEWWTGPDGITRPYTSARLHTSGRFSFQYGTAAARVHIPRGRGLWPAFWALGDNIGSVGWPLCGEIDVMENIGSRPRTVFGTVHAARDGGGNWLAGSLYRADSPLSRDYHVYGVDWGPSAISMWLDGVPYMTVGTADVPPGDLWNFNHAFHLVLNLAVGGTFAGPPNDRTRFPAILAVDYVHVWS